MAKKKAPKSPKPEKAPSDHVPKMPRPAKPKPVESPVESPGVVSDPDAAPAPVASPGVNPAE